MILSHTQLQTWRTCRRQWQWSRQFRPNKTNLNLWVGTVIHATLAMMAEGNSWEESLLTATRQHSAELGDPDLVEEQYRLMGKMLEHYELWLADQPKLKTQEVELQISIPLGEDQLIARIDQLVTKPKSRELWIREFKTTSRIDNVFTTLSEQASLYVWAVQHLYPKAKVGGVIFEVLAKAVPVEPTLRNGVVYYPGNVKGSIYYAERLAKQHKTTVPPELYDRLTIAGRGAGYFKREEVTRSSEQIVTLKDRVIILAQEIHGAQAYPSFGAMTCQYCDFLEPCTALEQGANYNALLSANYKPKGGETRAN